MSTPILLYSTTTWLAYQIAENYYGGRHYLWCSAYLDNRDLPSRMGRMPPPTSSPFDIYHNLLDEIKAGDRHSAKISENKAGILKGAAIKKQFGIISLEQEQEIHEIVENAETRDFEPFIFVIPYHLVQSIVTVVPVNQRAHPMWIEYRIEELPPETYHVIKLVR